MKQKYYIGELEFKTKKECENYTRNIINNLKCVDEVFSFNDSDGTVCQLLKIVKICYPNADITYVSEMDMHNMPEMKIRGINFETMK